MTIFVLGIQDQCYFLVPPTSIKNKFPRRSRPKSGTTKLVDFKNNFTVYGYSVPQLVDRVSPLGGGGTAV